MTTNSELKNSTVFYKPELLTWEKEGIHYFLDGESPNWISTDERGAKIMRWIEGQKSFGDIIHLYSQDQGMDLAKSWLHCHVFLKDAISRGVVTLQPKQSSQYLGRSHYLKPERLKEFWIHLTQTCNLACSHCLVSSSPKGEKGATTEFYFRVIDETREMGTERYYFTGGEPFVRTDILDLIRYVTETKQRELIILTNATLISPNRLEQLKTLNREKVKFQVSIDGTTARTNDAIRGEGVFEKACQGLKSLSNLGFETSLTSVVTKQNLTELESLPELAKSLGAKSIHLMWLHKRGRILHAQDSSFPTVAELLHLAKTVKQSSEKLGILFDNLGSLRLRVNGQPNVKYDLGIMCWESLCLYLDGHLYPSAAMAGYPDLSIGTVYPVRSPMPEVLASRQVGITSNGVNGKTIRDLWLKSDLANQIREVSVIQKYPTSNDPFKYLTGGGDIEHSYFFSANGRGEHDMLHHWDGRRGGCPEQQGTFLAVDPYYELYVGLIKEIMADLSMQKKRPLKSGFDAPMILHAMGEDAVTCSEDAQGWLEKGALPKVRLLHSNCVLSFDVEKPYKAVQKFYGKAAEKPQKELCCPIKYDDSEIGHIPQEVIDRFYGCGSPISMSQVKPGETVLDLGSGAGIDCFIAAKKVGPNGKVIGIDMTDQMIEVANLSKAVVAKNIGYDVVEFKRGYLEKIPVPEHSVDLVTSNCVINLSPDKKKVFAEIWRILKDTGRLVVSDIVSDQHVPLSLQAHQDLWGECISGCLSEKEFLSQLEKAGFYGISLLKKIFWKKVEGVKFYSITIRGFKFEKKAVCKGGQKAIYLGPYKAAIDEEGHLFPRGEEIEVCTDTATKLKMQPYAEQFKVIEINTDPSTLVMIDSVADGNCCTGTTCCKGK